MADTLRDLSHRELVHNVLRGLDERLQHAVPHMTRGRRPTFIKLRSFLQLEEQRLARQARVQARTTFLAQASAYYAARPPSPTPAPAAFNNALLSPNLHAAGSSGGSSGSRGRPKKRKPNPSSGSGGSSSRGANSAGLPQGSRAPTTVLGIFQGILGARPPAPAPAQAHQATTMATSSSQWDQAVLIAALNQMALHPPSAPGGEWVLDSDASSHMSSGSGFGHQDGASPM
ncbi:hypothetical protein ACQJBY_041540 [Aegilops geniculata]